MKNAVQHSTTNTIVKIGFRFEFYVTGTAHSYYLFYRGNRCYVNKNHVKNQKNNQNLYSLNE